jgi:hypothetical protein
MSGQLLVDSFSPSARHIFCTGYIYEDEGAEIEHRNLNNLAEAVKYLDLAAAAVGHLPVPTKDINTGLPSPLPQSILQGSCFFFLLEWNLPFIVS